MSIEQAARIHIAAPDVPEQLGQHAKIVIQAWLAHAHEAGRKGDLYEAHRLLALARRKISDEMSRQRCGETD